jgi:hypothetical protein
VSAIGQTDLVEFKCQRNLTIDEHKTAKKQQVLYWADVLEADTSTYRALAKQVAHVVDVLRCPALVVAAHYAVEHVRHMGDGASGHKRMAKHMACQRSSKSAWCSAS